MDELQGIEPGDPLWFDTERGVFVRKVVDPERPEPNAWAAPSNPKPLSLLARAAHEFANGRSLVIDYSKDTIKVRLDPAHDSLPELTVRLDASAPLVSVVVLHDQLTVFVARLPHE